MMEGNIITTTTTTVDNDDDDRISELPDFVAHHILSFLFYSPKNLIRISVLSKRCLPFILKQGLQVFDIFDSELPNILQSVSSLTSLSISNCDLPYSFKYGDDDLVRFKLLKTLYLGGVCLSEQAIKCLTAGCPLLEEFTVNDCYGFERLCVCGLQNLRKVAVCYDRSLEEIDIQAPNLSDIFLSDGLHQKGAPPCINLFSAKKLSMIFYGCFSEEFAVSLSNFPFLVTLILKLSYNDTNLKLSSHSLRTLRLDTRSDLEEIEIDTPNLLYFQYSSSCLDEHLYEHRPIRNSGESKACMECYRESVSDTIWFQNIRQILDNSIAFKVLKLHIVTSFIDVEELKLPQWPPFELEHIELNALYINELSEYVPILEAVLWCCRPQSLTLKSFYFYNDLERNQIVKFTYEKLLQQEDKGKTNIQIVSSTVNSCGSNDLLITFSKEEVGQKASQDSAVQNEKGSQEAG